jgi:hypothetical protein
MISWCIYKRHETNRQTLQLGWYRNKDLQLGVRRSDYDYLSNVQFFRLNLLTNSVSHELYQSRVRHKCWSRFWHIHIGHLMEQFQLFSIVVDIQYLLQHCSQDHPRWEKDIVSECFFCNHLHFTLYSRAEHICITYQQGGKSGSWILVDPAGS